MLCNHYINADAIMLNLYKGCLLNIDPRSTQLMLLLYFLLISSVFLFSSRDLWNHTLRPVILIQRVFFTLPKKRRLWGHKLAASSKWRSEMPLNSLQCTGQFPTAKSHQTQNVDSAEIEKLHYKLRTPA